MTKLEFDPNVVSLNPDTFFSTYILSPLTLFVAFIFESKNLIFNQENLSRLLKKSYDSLQVSKVVQYLFQVFKNVVSMVLSVLDKGYRFLVWIVSLKIVQFFYQSGKEVIEYLYNKFPALQGYATRGYNYLNEKVNEFKNSDLMSTLKFRANWILEKLKENLQNLREKIPTSWEETKDMISKYQLQNTLLFKFVRLYCMACIFFYKVVFQFFEWIFDKILMNEHVIKMVKKVMGYETPKTGVSSQGFTLGVTPYVKELEDIGKYQVEMKEKQNFGIVLYNYNWRRANCKVKLWGNEIGVFRLDPFSKYTVLRPIKENSNFAFDKEGTLEAEFYPEVLRKEEEKEKKEKREKPSQKREEELEEEDLAKVDQKFGKAPLITVDFTKKVTLVINLIQNKTE